MLGYFHRLLEWNAVLPFGYVVSMQKRNPSVQVEGQLRQELVHFGGMLHSKGFVSAMDGNLSVRLDSERILITPTGCSKGMLKPTDMVITDLSGKRLSGFYNASSEIAMHLAIYGMRPDVRAVVHAHPCTATAFASAGIALDVPLCSEVVITLGSVPLAPYATPGSAALSESLKPLIGKHDAILMANHGVVCCGENLVSAYMKMEAVEHYAKIVLTTRLLGSGRMLQPNELAELLEARSRYTERFKSSRQISIGC
jgi:L-fuculose-phosphate aldolase